ncbi:NrsF family protein [Sorangium sp. So ce1151]|uniref:NrsF family protein n=1 Tax=Sorangium sp. So ce1151 TaxID=3133332 RepID=UPI003F6388D5
MTDERELLKQLEDIPDPAAHVAPRLAARPPAPAEAPAEPSLTRPARERRGLFAIVGGLAWVLLFSWIEGFRDDLGSPRVIVPLAVAAVLAGLGLLLALRRRARGLPAGVRALQALVVAVPVGFLVAAVVRSRVADPPVPLELHVRCIASALATALPPFALAALMLRRSFLSAPAWRGASIGALCGLGAAVGLETHCALDDLLHVTFAHGLPIAAGALLGAAAGALHGRA